MTRARWFHLTTFLVAAFALVLQFVLIWQGHKAEVSDVGAGPDLTTRIVRFCSYLTMLFAVVGWLVLGPRRRATGADPGPFLVVPVGWLAYTLVRGAFVDWYPYPFVDVGLHGYGVVALNSPGVAAFLIGLAFLAIGVDGKLSEQ